MERLRKYLVEMRPNILWSAITLIGGAIMSTIANSGFLRFLTETPVDVKIMIGLFVISLVFIFVGFFMGWRQSKRTKPTPVSASGGLPAPTIVVRGRTFINERVLLDGHRFIDCHFRHVTFVFNATAGYTIDGGDMDSPPQITTENPAVLSAFALLYGFGFTSDKFPFHDEYMKSPPNIQPIQWEKSNSAVEDSHDNK